MTDDLRSSMVNMDILNTMLYFISVFVVYFRISNT